MHVELHLIRKVRRAGSTRQWEPGWRAIFQGADSIQAVGNRVPHVAKSIPEIPCWEVVVDGALTVALGAGVIAAFKEAVEATVAVALRLWVEGFASRCLATKPSELEKSERLKNSLTNDSIGSVSKGVVM